MVSATPSRCSESIWFPVRYVSKETNSHKTHKKNMMMRPYMLYRYYTIENIISQVSNRKVLYSFNDYMYSTQGFKYDTTATG